jgi:hypothetical protein
MMKPSAIAKPKPSVTAKPKAIGYGESDSS